MLFYNWLKDTQSYATQPTKVYFYKFPAVHSRTYIWPVLNVYGPD